MASTSHAQRLGRAQDQQAEVVGDRLVTQRRLFVNLLSQAADEVELPADPELRAALIGYAEWGSRLAVHNSDPDADDIVTKALVPRWDWGVAPPYQG